MGFAVYGGRTERAVQALLKDNPVKPTPTNTVSRIVSKQDDATFRRNAAQRAKWEAFNAQVEANLAAYRERKLLERQNYSDAAEQRIKAKIDELALIRIAELDAEIIEAQTRMKWRGVFPRILLYASRKYCVPIRDIKGNTRSASVVMARQCVMYWARRLTYLSYPEIGRLLNGKDHTTILHGVRGYQKKMALRGIYLKPVR